MSDQGERTCPLCAEEMDLTDQQLKPCKCGYEICIWCWHHIMDMAEKDETEGRCPACRAPYNKEKIVGMAAKCERLVTEMNMERKSKSQKAKNKTSEGRKQLGSVRVIQRNLVYIVGLPLNLANEDLLQHKEYFGQYGKVLKVSISRTAAGTIQQFPNSTCSVYITYSKEDEAVRCIQSVHGFVLEGRSLRACFGTTKYCHAWLRNVPCSNPDCLYLHETGTQEDSFTKDEIISAYTRSRVQQITGATINMQRRSGNVLPAAADEYCNNSSASSGKLLSKSAANNSAIDVRGSPPNSSSGRHVALPAAASWGMHNPQACAKFSSSNGPPKQKPYTSSGSLAFSMAVTCPTETSLLHADIGKKLVPDEESHTSEQDAKCKSLEPVKHYMGTDSQATASEIPATPGFTASSTMRSQLYYPPASKDNDIYISMPPNIANSIDVYEHSCGSGGPEEDINIVTDGKTQNLCSDMLSMTIDRSEVAQQSYTEQSREPLTFEVGKAETSTKDTCVAREQSDFISNTQTRVAHVALGEVEEDLLSFDYQRLGDPEVVTNTSYFPHSSDSLYLLHHSRGYTSRNYEAYSKLHIDIDPPIVDKKVSMGSFPQESSTPVISNGYPENIVNRSANLDSTFENSHLLPAVEKRNHVGRLESEVANADCHAPLGTGENNIISNILSMDFDSWDEPLTSPQNLARLLGETDKQKGSLRVPSSWKVQNSNQSRFSFAREEDSTNHDSSAESSLNYIGQALKNRPFRHDFVGNKDFNLDRLGTCSGFSSVSCEESDNFASSHSHISSNKPSGLRAQISAPPGFAVPSRAPPPGFTSHERMEQPFDALTGIHMLDSTSSLGNLYHVPPAGNIGSPGEIEFMDPAILAVVKGKYAGGLNSPGLDDRSNFTPQLSTLENEARLQLLMQRSLSLHQNHRFAEMGDSFSPISNAYGIPSRIMEQTLTNNQSSFPQSSLPQSRNVVMSNGHWDGWNEVQGGNDLGMAELLRTERMGYNKFYNGYEDSKFPMPGSGNLYNRTFGI